MPITASNDALLAMINGIRAGSRENMNQLFTTMYSPLYGYAIKMVGENDADDMVNDTMMEIWLNSGAFKGEAKVSTWIFGILKNLCLQQYQKQSAKKRDPKELAARADELALELAIGMTEDENSILQLEEIDQHIQQQLSEEQRRAIELVAQGYSYKEIGEKERCPENTAKTRVFHARKILKEAMNLQLETIA